MVKVSELISKQLICLETASVIGTISNITFDDKLAHGKVLELFCEDDMSVEAKFVELKNVSSISSDASVIKRAESILLEWSRPLFSPNPINCDCFNQDGLSLGKVRDIILDGAVVSKILLDKAEFDPKDLLSYSSSLLIFNDSGKPIKIAKSKPKIPPSSSDTPVTLHNAENSIAANVPIEIPTKIAKQANSINGYEFLLGLPSHARICDSSGKTIISSGDKVTAETILAARACGKLVKLALYAY